MAGMSETLKDTSGRAVLQERAAPATKLTEDVETYSLDPDVYLAVVEAELGRAGIVNKNRRIYQREEFVEQNTILGKRVMSEFVDGELGHPEGGPTFSVPARLMGVDVVEMGDVEAIAVGKFAILNTTAGRDVLTLFRGGMPIGVSSRGEGVLTDLTIEEGTPIGDANPTQVGRTVKMVSEFLLDRYDLVRIPSAGTHLKQEESGADVVAAGLPLEASMKTENPVEPKAVEEKQAESIEEPTVVEAAPVDPLADLSDDQKHVLLRIIDAVKVEEAADDDALVGEIAALREQMEVDRHRSTVNEQEYQALKSEVAELREQREARKLRDALDGAIVEATAEKRFGVLVSEQLRFFVDEGVCDTETKVSDYSDRLFGLLNSATEPVVKPVEQEPRDVEENAAQDLPTVEGVDNTLGLDENLYQSIKTIMARDRARIGG